MTKSISEAYGKNANKKRIEHVEEISGHGIKAVINGKTILVGNDKLLHKENIDHPVCNVDGTVVHVAIDAVYAGHIIISDTLKNDAVEAIETADIVLMTDSPAKVAVAMDVAKRTRNIVWQNIVFALGIKLLFIVGGIFGVATMWEAVFGDMGVALIAVFNAIRILKN